MRIAVVGTGYVGLVTGACLAETGNHVICVDKDAAKIEMLLGGEIPIYEPGLKRIVNENAAAGRLEFTTDLDGAVRDSRIIFIAVGTPPQEDGSADLSQVEAVARQVGRAMNGYRIIVDKSTVPVGTAKRVKEIIDAETSHRFSVVSNPEFLKEGAAVRDFMQPDRVVIGAEDDEAIETMHALYAPYMRRSDRLLVMDLPSAEMTKYASNAMLATRISFMNEVARLCEKVGANAEMVRRGMASDVRIGEHFLFPGVGFGGSCFPKDLKALRHTGEVNGFEMSILKSVSEVNDVQKRVLVEKIKRHFGGDVKDRTFALWGLAFKPGTDDMREAPSLEISRGLLEAGARVRASDPIANEVAREQLDPRVELAEDPYAILDGADGLVLVTEWLQFRTPDFEGIRDRLKTKVIFDGRNIWSRQFVERHGLTYYGIGV